MRVKVLALSLLTGGCAWLLVRLYVAPNRADLSTFWAIPVAIAFGLVPRVAATWSAYAASPSVGG